MKRVLKQTILALAGLQAGVGFSQEPFVPEGIGSASLRRIVTDTIAHVYETRSRLNNWEPYISVLGNSIFLIQSNTFAEDPGDPPDPAFQMMRYGLLFQRAGGGVPAYGEVFFADGGTPYKGPVNNYRQNGNPGRVAGDRRPGAASFIAGGEASPDEVAAFRSDGRWDTGVSRGGRYATVQTHSVNPDTLEQAPLCKAFDALNGRLTSGNPGTAEISRFGGDLAALDDGNFVAVVDDRSGLHNQHLGGGRATAAVIIAPDGAIVKDTFIINQGDIWCNLAAFQGGFCIRQQVMLRFFNNRGEFQGAVDQAPPELVDPLGQPILFERDRGDHTRIAGHINSPYVFLAGAVTDALGRQVFRLAAWDSRDRAYIAQVNVNELTPANGGLDAVDFLPPALEGARAHLAADALNRVVVAFEVKPEDFTAVQTAARVFEFDAAKRAFNPLTPTFFPFANSNPACAIGSGLPQRSYRPSTAITTREICIAAKGDIDPENKDGDSDRCADSPALVNFYTVISHPDPRADPTIPVPSPGGGQVPGDCNQDGQADISDAICLLSHLFLGDPALRRSSSASLSRRPGRRSRQPEPAEF